MAKAAYHYKTLLNITTISNGSDCLVKNPDVLKGIQLALTGTPPGGTGPYLIEWSLTCQVAIEESIKGKIRRAKVLRFCGT